MKIGKLFLLVLTGLLLSGVSPQMAHASAFGDLIDAGGGYVPDVPDVPDPTPVDEPSDSGGGYDDSSSGSNDTTPTYTEPTYTEPTYTEPTYTPPAYNPPATYDDSAYQQRQQENREYRQQQREKQAEKRRENAEKRRKNAKKRRDAREDRQWEEKHRKEAEEAKRHPKYVSPPQLPRATLPSLRPPKVDVAEGTEAAALTENQFRIAALLKKPSLTAQEQELLQQLNTACRKLWAKAVKNENLSTIERSKIRLNVPVLDFADSQVGSQLASQLAEIKKTLNVSNEASVDLIKKYNKEKFQQLLEQEAGDLADSVVAGGQEAFENYAGAAKVTAAIIQNDIPAAGKEILDFAVGKISSPQASFAVEGGRMYSEVTFKALDNFMVKAMNSVGQDFDLQEFWKKVRGEMNVGQLTVMEFIGGPDGK